MRNNFFYLNIDRSLWITVRFFWWIRPNVVRLVFSLLASHVARVLRCKLFMQIRRFFKSHRNAHMRRTYTVAALTASLGWAIFSVWNSFCLAWRQWMFFRTDRQETVLLSESSMTVLSECSWPFGHQIKACSWWNREKRKMMKKDCCFIQNSRCWMTGERERAIIVHYDGRFHSLRYSSAASGSHASCIAGKTSVHFKQPKKVFVYNMATVTGNLQRLLSNREFLIETLNAVRNEWTSKPFTCDDEDVSFDVESTL